MLAPRRLGYDVERVLCIAQEPSRGPEEHVARVGERHALPVALEERRAELLLEISHLPSQRRL